MAASNQWIEQLSSQEWASLEERIAQFEKAWQQGLAPTIDDFLPSEPLKRLALLLELLHADQDYRFRAGRPIRVEDYLARYPELKEDRPGVVALIAAEYQIRRRQDPGLDREGFVRRFPGYRAELEALLWAAGEVPLFTVPEQKTVPAQPADTGVAGEQRLPALPDAPVIPGYEILAVLGRGGMGVVYKALQVRLKRLVALKMMLAGAHATADEMARFRTEVEAVARFQHPHIVQIHEVSEHAGRPFCVLELVDGGTLARKLAGRPLPPDEAAALTETLARALHYAHQRQVVHRDLKPGNVLLTSEGQPKIADFGLAKQLDSDHGRTQSGQILGTPSYMAPEQASGHCEAIGPATDVYALGAILYELLTGQPPFAAPSVLLLLEQVRSADPVPPSRRQANVPPDLETICLKCLQKQPAERYSSALALALDLERFGAHQPILARPEGWLRKVGRKLRRHRVALLTGLVGGLVLLGAGLFALGGREARRLSDLQSAVETGLETLEWTPAQMEEVEGRIDSLAQAAPEQGAQARTRMLGRVCESLQKVLDRPRLEAAEVVSFEATLQALASRDAGLAKDLRQRLRQRLRAWEVVHELTPPFLDRDKVFAPGDVSVRQEQLVCQRAAESVLTTVPCLGPVQLEAVFDRSWVAVSAVGLLLNASQAHRYSFVVSASSAFRSDGERQLRDTRRYLQIRRDGVCLREQETVLAEGPLTLKASREGDKLQFEVNSLTPLVFLDPLPLASPQTVCGLLWPNRVPLKSLHVHRQALPLTPSPLERGDDLYAVGQYASALEAYQRQGQEAGGVGLGQEARYKMALCLEHLQRLDEAMTLFGQLAGEEGDRWPLAAAARLWLLYLEQQRFAEAEAVLVSLSARSRFEELVVLLPEDIRHRILDLYGKTLSGGNLLVARPDLASRADQVVRAADFLWGGKEALAQAHFIGDAMRAYQVAGQPEKALQAGAAFLKRCEGLPVEKRLVSAERVLREYVWLLRLRGQAQQALALLDHWLYKAPGVYRCPDFVLRTVVERARLQSALNRWVDMAADVVECFRLLNLPEYRTDYTSYSATCLMQGFLFQRVGLEPLAQSAWSNGTWKAWWRRHGQKVPALEEIPPLTSARGLQNLILLALSNELSDAEARYLLDQGVASFSDASASRFADLAAIPPSAMRQMWQSPRGRQCARQIAFHEVSHTECLRLPVFLLAFEVMRQGAFAEQLSAEQDALLWHLIEDTFALYARGKLGKTRIVQLGLTWKGVTGFLSWDAVAPSLPPSQRGPLAYVLGRRLLRLQKPAEAEKLFRTAAGDAVPASPLDKLVRAELERLKRR